MVIEEKFRETGSRIAQHLFFHEKNNTILFMFLDSSSEVIIFQAARTNGQPLNFFVCVALFSRFSAIIQDESSNLIPVFFKFLFLFHFFSWFIYWWWLFTSFFLFVKKCPGGECISVSDFFSLVFSSIGFPIEKHKKFRIKEKTATIFYYYLGQWNSLFFVTVFIWAVFFFRFFFSSLEQCLSADCGNSSNGEIFYVSLPLRRQLEELHSHPLYAIDMNL